MVSDDRLNDYLYTLAQTEDEALRAARSRSRDAGVPEVDAQVGALLRWLARVSNARHAVEIGTGAGYSGLWLLGGMPPRGALTTIEVDSANQGLARKAFTEAGVADQARCMLGRALEVLPRLADDSYDLVLLDAVKAEYTAYLTHALRLLRPGGLVVADNVIWGGRVADPQFTDADTEGLREFNAEVRDDPELDQVVLPVGDGVLAAWYTPVEAATEPIGATP